MGSLQIKPGVEFSVIAPAGQRILDSLKTTADALPFDLTITSGTDGTHSGPNDPHHRGEAYDVRSHEIDDKESVLTAVLENLADGALAPSSGGYVTKKFFGWLENANGANEHFHFQLRHGVQY